MQAFSKLYHFRCRFEKYPLCLKLLAKVVKRLQTESVREELNDESGGKSIKRKPIMLNKFLTVVLGFRKLASKAFVLAEELLFPIHAAKEALSDERLAGELSVILDMEWENSNAMRNTKEDDMIDYCREKSAHNEVRLRKTFVLKCQVSFCRN